MSDLDLSTCIGSQTPRLANYPCYFTSLGDDAIDLAAVAGIDLLPWQETLVRESMGQKMGGTGDAAADALRWGKWQWSSTSSCLIAPRQNGKNVVVYVRQLAGIHLLKERIMYSAHEFDTARDAHRELVAAIGFNEDLEDEFILPHKIGAAELSIRHTNGAFIHYVARGKNARRGRTRIDLMILDEAFALDDDMMGSLSPLQQASLNPQTWYTSSAGTEESPVLTRIRGVGTKLAEDPANADHSTLMFAEWGCKEGSDATNFENWVASNPSLGVLGIAPVERLTEDFEQKMSLQQFAREHLGMWDDPAMSSVIPFDAWKAANVECGPDVGARRVICVDVDPDKAWASISVAEEWPDGRHHVEVIESHPGTNWVLSSCTKLMASSNPPLACVVQGGGRAGEMSPELEQIGYNVVIFGSADIAMATGQFYSDIVPDPKGEDYSPDWVPKCTHLDDAALLTALGGSAKYKIGPEIHGGWGWLRKGTSIDITGIVGCSYANRVLTLLSVLETLTATKKHRLL